MMYWNSAADSLPKQSGTVLCRYRRPDSGDAMFMGMLQYHAEGSEPYFCNADGDATMCVTDWVKLEGRNIENQD